MKQSILTIFTILTSLISATAEPIESPEEFTDLPPNMKTEGHFLKTKILKIYSASSPTGATYVGYVIKWQGSEVVVNNLLGANTSEKPLKVGDTINVMAQEIEMKLDGEKVHIVQFMFVGPSDDKSN